MVICFSRSDTWYIPFQVVVCESFHLYACKQKHQASPEPYRISGLNFAIHPLIIMIYKHLVTFAFGAFAQQTVTAIGKFSCGRLRPHFFDGCRPDFSQFNCTGNDGLPAYVTNFECTGTDQKVLDDIRWVLTHCSIVMPYVGRTWSPLMEVMTYYTPPPPKVEWGYTGFTLMSVRPSVGTLHSLEWFWVSRRIFIYSHHNTYVFSLRRPFVHGLFVSWGATGWWFVINSRANINVTIDCSTVLPLVLGVVTRQKLHINGSVVLGADESPWPCGTPSWYTPLSWMILSKQKNLHLFSSQYICVFSKTSVCRQGFRNFLKKLLAQLISYLIFTLMGWVSWTLFIFVFLASFLALWWPNIWPNMGFPELFEKIIGPIHFIPGIYPYGVSLLTPIHFRVPSLIFGPLVAKYLAKNGVSGTFWKNCWLNSFHTWHLALWGEFLDPYTFLCS